MYIYIFICIYIYIYVCSYLSIYICIYSYLSISTYVYIYMHSKLQGRQAAHPRLGHTVRVLGFFQWASFWAHTAAVLGFILPLVLLGLLLGLGSCGFWVLRLAMAMGGSGGQYYDILGRHGGIWAATNMGHLTNKHVEILLEKIRNWIF